MPISITDVSNQNLIFIGTFLISLLLSIKFFKTDHSFTPQLTEELKGFAILAIIFSHIGYFLITDHQFLFPLSMLAGVGVNLFLFLSGMGLTLSALQKPISITQFYLKRLPKLLIPMWIVLTLFLLADYFVLHKTYPLVTTIENYFGFFPRANLFLDINSPLWYFTMILFYYLLFPLIFHKKLYYLSPILFILIPHLVFKLSLPDKDVVDLYKVHYDAFPLGVFVGIAIAEEKLSSFRHHFKKIFLRSVLKFLLVPVFLGIFAYTSYYSGVGQDKIIEQTTSLITMFSIVFLFLAKNFRMRLFSLFGNYSYEIYLLHWPLLARYDIFYHYLPASIATMLYLGEFIVAAFILRQLTQKSTWKKLFKH